MKSLGFIYALMIMLFVSLFASASENQIIRASSQPGAQLPAAGVMYDVYASFYAKNFAQAEVVWRNVLIAFPLLESEVQVYDAEDFDGNEDAIRPPYTVQYAEEGRETYYSLCEDELETPEIISIKSLMDGQCWLETGEDALNQFSIERAVPSDRPEINVVLQFDMFCGEGPGRGQQLTVGTDSDFPDATTFPWKELDEDIINKLMNGEKAVKQLTNPGGETLTIIFEPK